MSIDRDRLALVDAMDGKAVEMRAPLPIAPSDAGLTRIEGDLMLYQAEENTQVVAYDLSRQELLWKRPLRREIAERFGCDVGAVVLRPVGPDAFLAHVTSRIVVGCSLADGSILWDMAVPFDSPVVPYGDRVYVMLAEEGPGSSPRLICLDAATGARVYDVPQPELNAMDLASFGSVHEDYIGFGTRGGLVGLFRLADGGLAWSHRHKVRLYMPVMTDERLYVCTDDGNLLIFEAG
jgi:outer membrane protein assembly factor BamB